MPEQATPHNGSLEGAGKAIESLLSISEDTRTPVTQPEQVPAKEAKATPASEPEPKQVPAAEAEGQEQPPEDSEPAQEQDDETEPTPESQPRTFKVKVDGRDIEVTEDEVLKGYSRTEDYTRKTQALAEQRKAFEEKEVAAVRAERAQYATYLTELKGAITSLAPVEPNWETLRMQVTPEVFAAELLNWQQNAKRIEKIEAEQAKVAQQQEEDARQGFAKYVAQEQDRLTEKLPDLKDPEKAVAIKKELTTFAKTAGFTDEELGQVTDHRLVLLLHQAMQYQKAQQKAPTIQNKIDKATVTVAPGNRTPAAPRSKLDAARERLKRSGSVEDGAAAIAHLL